MRSTKRRGDGLSEPTVFEIVSLRENPDVVKILEPTVGKTQRHHRLKLFSDYRPLF
jgi:hypothetical protein